MGARGPKAAHAQGLTIIGGGGIEAVRRPDPPAELIGEQVHIWREIVNRMPADWFPVETQPMLVQYCRHITRAKDLAGLIERARHECDPVDFAKLLAAEEVQSRAISSLATRMRLSQKTQYERNEKKKGPVVGPSELWAGA